MDSKKKGRRLGALAWILAVGAGMSVAVGMSGTLASASQLDNGGFAVRAVSADGEHESIAGRFDAAPDMKLGEGDRYVYPVESEPGMLEFRFMVSAQPDRFVRVYQDGREVGSSYTSSASSVGNTMMFTVRDSEELSTKIEACYGDGADAAKRSGCVVIDLSELLR